MAKVSELTKKIKEDEKPTLEAKIILAEENRLIKKAKLAIFIQMYVPNSIVLKLYIISHTINFKTAKYFLGI